jgi:hypothetical protein
MEGTARESSKLYQIGNIQANQLFLGNESAASLLERIQQSGKAESVGILKTGDLPKSLAYWQGRTEEIAQICEWLINENVSLIGIEGIGGTGKSMLAAKIYEEIEGFPKRAFTASLDSTSRRLNCFSSQRQFNRKSAITDYNGEAKAWFILGLALENVNRESDAVDAYRNARDKSFPI